MSERDALIAEARRLRIDDGLPTSQIAARLGMARSTVRGWLAGLPPAAGTGRPRAKDEIRQRALALRRVGWTVPEIAEELRVAPSTAWRWVGHLKLDAASVRNEARRQAAQARADIRWRAHRRDIDARRSRIAADSVSRVGDLDDRDLALVGAALYWCEGAKCKPWRQWVTVTFVNSDPVLVRLFLAFLEGMDIEDERIDFRLHIHESVDAAASVRWWAEQLGVQAETFRRTTLKKHRPSTTRRNLGADYHGCLAVSVRRGRELYWRIEGIMDALAASLGHTREMAR